MDHSNQVNSTTASGLSGCCDVPLQQHQLTNNGSQTV